MSYSLTKFPTTFGGHVCFQRWQDLYLWEHLLNDTYGLKAIVEFGTAYGGFSQYLMVQAELRGLEFHTFDYHDPDLVPLEDLWDMPKERLKMAPLVRPYMQIVDLLDKPAIEVVELLADRRVVLFCDNGNKRREVELYAEHLFPGSLLVVHDWVTEIDYVDIPEGYVELYGDLCDEMQSITRVFRKQ